MLTQAADDGAVRSTAERDRRLVRRAALQRAMAVGDVLGVARAWDRLRASGAALTPTEAEAARAARHAVGHAIRDARWRREHGADRVGFHLDAAPAPAIRPRVARWWPVIAATAAALVALLGIVLWQPGGTLTSGPAAQPATTQPPADAVGQGRGRTSATQAPVARATPTVAPIATIPVIPVPGATGAPGVGTGSGTGVGFIPPLAPSDDRFLITVRDAQTMQVIPGVCITYGQADCGERKTNANGVWWIDFPRSGTIAPTWRFDLRKDGYLPHTEEVKYTPGGQITIEILIRKAS